MSPLVSLIIMLVGFLERAFEQRQQVEPATGDRAAMLGVVERLATLQARAKWPL